MHNTSKLKEHNKKLLAYRAIIKTLERSHISNLIVHLQTLKQKRKQIYSIVVDGRK